MQTSRIFRRCCVLTNSKISCLRSTWYVLSRKRPRIVERMPRFRHHFCTSSKTSQFSDESMFDNDEVTKLSKGASDWWDVYGEFHALHSMNRVRVPFIKNALLSQHDESITSQAMPLRGFNILDIGCGGGILSEALARLGANVTGIDASARNIHVAMRHSSLDPLLSKRLGYKCITAQELAEDDHMFDCVVSSEVIEHVTDKDSFIEAIGNLLKPGGSVVMTTLAQTTKSYLAAIVAAEYLTHMVTVGTHDWNKFITADDLKDLLVAYNLETVSVQGLCYNPLLNNWSFMDDTSVNYAIHAVKTDFDFTEDTEDSPEQTSS